MVNGINGLNYIHVSDTGTGGFGGTLVNVQNANSILPGYIWGWGYPVMGAWIAKWIPASDFSAFQFTGDEVNLTLNDVGIVRVTPSTKIIIQGSPGHGDYDQSAYAVGVGDFLLCVNETSVVYRKVTAKSFTPRTNVTRYTPTGIDTQHIGIMGD